VLERVHAGQKVIPPELLTRALDLSLHPEAQAPSTA
jgi:hypothetical protein